MSKNRKVIKKEWHTKRLDFTREYFICVLEDLASCYDIERLFGSEEFRAFKHLLDVFYSHRNNLKVDECCGQYVVEYGYDIVSKE